MMVEYGEQFWRSAGGLCTVSWGATPGCHALPALRHVGDGRPCPRGERAASAGAVGLDLRRRRWASRSSTSASTTWSICSPASRWPRASAAPRRARRRSRERLSRRACVRSRHGRGHDGRDGGTTLPWSAPRRLRVAESAAAARRGRRATAAARSRSTRAAWLRSAASSSRRSRALLPAAAARRPRRHVEADQGGRPAVARSPCRLHGGDVRRLRGDVPRRLRARRRRGSAGARATRSRWPALAATRLFAAGGAGGARADGVGAAARRDAPARGGRPDARLPRPDLLRLHRGRRRLRLRAALRALPGRGAFAFTLVPAMFGLLVIAIALAVALVPTDLAARAWRASRRRGRLGAPRAQLAQLPAAISAGMRDAIAARALGDPALLGAIAFWGFQIAVLWAAFHAFGEAAAVGRARQALLRRHAGQPAPDARRRRRRRGRDDRRARRLRRRTAGWRSSPCSPTARSRSGCPIPGVDRLLPAATTIDLGRGAPCRAHRAGRDR